MFCCEALGDAVDQGSIYFGPFERIDDGRVLNELNTEYFLRSPSSRGYNYTGINYCPFCGRAISVGLWSAEKKK